MQKKTADFLLHIPRLIQTDAVDGEIMSRIPQVDPIGPPTGFRFDEGQGFGATYSKGHPFYIFESSQWCKFSKRPRVFVERPDTVVFGKD